MSQKQQLKKRLL